ncbi:hypothetical protein [Sinorhizobium medicae]
MQTIDQLKSRKMLSLARGLFISALVVVVSTVIAMAATKSSPARTDTTAEATVDLSTMSNGSLVLHCFEKDLKKKLQLELDIPNEKVVYPASIKWAKIKSYNPVKPGDRRKRRIVLVPDTFPRNELVLYDNGMLADCPLDDPLKDDCDTYHCYPKLTPIF